MLRPTVSRSVVLVSSTHLGITTRFLLLSQSCGFVDVGRSLWRENGSAVYNCCWSDYSTRESASELLYDWWYTANKFVLAPSPLRLTARIFFLNWTPAVIFLIYHPVREDGSAIYNCCWPSPEHSFSGLCPVGLATIFYCLRFETSLFIASYDSQGYGGSIRPRLHTGRLVNQKGERFMRIEGKPEY
jgi:hypothetical protein